MSVAILCSLAAVAHASSMRRIFARPGDIEWQRVAESAPGATGPTGPAGPGTMEEYAAMLAASSECRSCIRATELQCHPLRYQIRYTACLLQPKTPNTPTCQKCVYAHLGMNELLDPTSHGTVENTTDISTKSGGEISPALTAVLTILVLLALGAIGYLCWASGKCRHQAATDVDSDASQVHSANVPLVRMHDPPLHGLRLRTPRSCHSGASQGSGGNGSSDGDGGATGLGTGTGSPPARLDALHRPHSRAHSHSWRGRSRSSHPGMARRSHPRRAPVVSPAWPPHSPDSTRSAPSVSPPSVLCGSVSPIEVQV